MISTKEVFSNMINAPMRAHRGRVEIYKGADLLLTCGCHDVLKSFEVERVGEGKFFGYGIGQRLNVHLVDPERKLEVSTENYLECVLGVGSDYMYPFPNFYVTEVNRDEKTNELSITAYDVLHKAAALTVSQLNLPVSYTIRDFAGACAALLGVPLKIVNVDDTAFATMYSAGANFSGTETIREALNAVAEATQTIYYVSNEWELTFKRLDVNGAAALAITKDKYFELESGENRRLSKIMSATELGDNVGAGLAVSGSTQYVRENAFWALRDDIATLVDNALTAIGGITINQFECEWRGNYLLEIGDKISLTKKDGSIAYSYVLDDVITFNGTLSEKTRWSYEDDETETEENPTELGDVLKQTYARVDKASRQIELVSSEAGANKEAIAALQINTDSISASVKQVEENVKNEIAGVADDVAALTSQVQAKMTAEDVTIEIQKELSKGVERVVTSTGFTFDDEGLSVSKTGSEMTTQITEDGMRVYRSGEEMLKANNEGVKAVNLHAYTYLIIGESSRLEDYIKSGEVRTGCFWIGG